MLALFLSLALPALSVVLKPHVYPETLQMQLQPQLGIDRAQERRLKQVEPIEWIHFPKSGSSFVNAITHMPGTCPFVTNHALNEDTVGGGTCWLNRWLEGCSRVCNVDKYSCPKKPHLPVSNYSAARGHLVGMFRDPDQRILSGYHDEANNFAAEDYQSYLIEQSTHQIQQSGGNCTGSLVRNLPKRQLLDFAGMWKGSMAYQLTAEHDNTSALDPRRPRVTARDAVEAARRVREGFAFVGLTEEWDLSICLFHKMFGGICRAFEFEDTRPSYAGKTADQDYNTSQLLGWHDDIDEVVYTAASEVFRRNLILFNVSHETCQECFGDRERDLAFR
mmetsp:Transcript_63238/g.148519  ORF Transcript_63238/g.148519 Transcript_63238/m.148519 type:complete len:334 (+) Transcript_63238:62-1063(+)